MPVPVHLALRFVRGTVLPPTLDRSVACDEALAAALALASPLLAADASAGEGRRSGEGIRPPSGDFHRLQVLDEA